VRFQARYSIQFLIRAYCFYIFILVSVILGGS
jgi:hypothetical protein